MAQKKIEEGFEYSVSFHRYSVSGNNDFRVSGENVSEMVLEGKENRVIKIEASGDQGYMAEGVQIRIENEIDGDSNDYTVFITFRNPSVFPVTIHYDRRDYTTDSYSGFQGSIDPYILRLILEDGVVKSTNKRGKRERCKLSLR